MTRLALTIALFIGPFLVTGLAGAQPPQGEIVLNNDSVRVTPLTFRPGGGTGRHLGLEEVLSSGNGHIVESRFQFTIRGSR